MTETTDVRVWDLPTRLFHWLLAALVFTAYFTGGEDEGVPYALHVGAGYGIGVLILFRLIWGFVGSTHARFGTFTPAPTTVLRYVGGLLRGQPPSYLGHNPLGALNIYLLLGLLAGVVWTGLAMLTGDEEEIHEGIANLVMVLVGLHLVGVVADSLLTKENLTLAMLTGRKRRAQTMPAPAEARARPVSLVGAAGVTAVLAWGLATVTPFLTWPPPAHEEHEHEHEHEHGGGAYGHHEAEEHEHGDDWN